MGGENSGWYGSTYKRWSRKRRVDECVLVLPIEDFRDRFRGLEITRPVVLEVLWGDGRVGFQVADVTPRCERKRPRPQDDLNRYVDLEPHPWPIYGTRWFFRCACNRRCGRLYSVRDRGPILCRICHDLSYRSAQEYDIVQRRGRFPLNIHRMIGIPPPPGSYKVRKRAAVSGRHADW